MVPSNHNFGKLIFPVFTIWKQQKSFKIILKSQMKILEIKITNPQLALKLKLLKNVYKVLWKN